MPNCTIEYSASLENKLDPNQLVENVQEHTIASGLFSPETVKTRAIAYNYHTAHDGNPHFIHITASILPGRTDKQKKQLAETIISGLQKLALKQVTFTVDVQELSQSYTKAIC
ncbi:5-carboxymethyl-2-hydroxymuconate Delta-isomerase [Hirschia maritima]|uniref:5-carboxymethyl-2-hydroxymuconate Delta-isomerase n=1 Tax=Hirschia maritima TaxID=1121961 RepID=UPI00037AF8CB|nr:5-carboxymethyl-2-hydroxymuconate Delta-isomerase [Hirschia maritima]